MMASAPGYTRGIVYRNAPGLPFAVDFSRLPRRSVLQSVSQKSVLVESLRRAYGEQMRSGNLLVPTEQILKHAGEAGVNLQCLVSGKTLMDLGCGRERMLSSIAFARSLGAQNYIGIDVCFPDNPSALISQLGITTTSNIGILLIEANMPDFLQLVPTSSPVVAMMNLITGDKELYFPEGISCAGFCTAVAGELTRVVQTGGIAFGRSSDTLSLLPSGNWHSKEEDGTIFAIRGQGIVH
ncbi:Uncharacterised protein [Candidatus Anstonella stagnisolia]|nr:Uncharacterised protein [Candidatus Anstonella stagnisolia]